MADHVLVEKFKEGYAAVFDRNWPLWVGGVLLALNGILLMAWGRPWGVAGGLRVWGDWFFYAIGLYQEAPSQALFLSDAAILTWGLLFGAFGSALMARQFKWQPAPTLELIKGLIGGCFMGVGSVMAGGCNVGGFYSAVAAGSVSGFAMMIGLMIGAVIGLKYLLWEIEHIPSKPPKASKPKEGGIDWPKVQPWLGVLFFLFMLGWAYSLALRAYTYQAVLLWGGIGMGLVIQRCRFCFVRGFRDPFMTGESVATRAVALSVMISVLGFMLIKWRFSSLEMVYIYHHWIGGLVGGVVFGIGMLLSGGCGSGSVWRAGEGQFKLILAVTTFALSNSLFKQYVFTSKVAKAWGDPAFLPHFTGYFGAILLTFLVVVVWWAVMAWNEETDKLTMV
ncbi:MAG: YeeE/YedE family protein [Deltaproteobacteria bacterium]|nr:YeeE/YedE family protein [Deltaproteobacteria bacterium]